LFSFKKRASPTQLELSLIVGTFQHLRDHGVMPTAGEMEDNTRRPIHAAGFKLSAEQEQVLKLACGAIAMGYQDKFEEMLTAFRAGANETELNSHVYAISTMLRGGAITPFPD
jgi:hypothetical protein